jgi:hypothetical protein
VNVQESLDINSLLGWLLDLERAPDSPHPDRFTEAGARQAAVRLADRAHKGIQAGIRGSDVDEAWATRAPSPSALTKEGE